MVVIDSETVYSVSLSTEDQEHLSSGGDISFELPSGDSVRIVGEETELKEVTTRVSDTDDDSDLDEIEKLVQEGKDESPEVEHIDESDVSDGNPPGNSQGMISIERGN